MVRRSSTGRTVRPKRPRLTPEQKSYRNRKRMESAFKKGNRFEDTVIGMFDPDHFELIHRTPTNEDTDGHFVQEMVLPDLKFREISSGKEFWVEVKYRARTHRDGSVTWCSTGQLGHYRETQTQSGDPVFVMFGLGGTVKLPNKTFLIRLNDLSDTVLEKKDYLHCKVCARCLMNYGQVERIADNRYGKR